MANPTLFQIGLLTIEVIGFNATGFEHELGADFAAKPVVGAPKPREFVGAADDTLAFTGKLYRKVLGGGGGLDTIVQMAPSGVPQMVVRGDGDVYGWYLVERFKAKHEILDATGVGREIAYDIKLVKSPVAATADASMSTLFALFS